MKRYLLWQKTPHANVGGEPRFQATKQQLSGEI